MDPGDYILLPFLIVFQLVVSTKNILPQNVAITPLIIDLYYIDKLNIYLAFIVL